MTHEQLSLGEKIMAQIISCKNNLDVAKIVKSGKCDIREAVFLIGYTDSLKIPEELFEAILDMVISEYRKQLEELEKQFESI